MCLMFVVWWFDDILPPTSVHHLVRAAEDYPLQYCSTVRRQSFVILYEEVIASSDRNDAIAFAVRWIIVKCVCAHDREK